MYKTVATGNIISINPLAVYRISPVHKKTIVKYNRNIQQQLVVSRLHCQSVSHLETEMSSITNGRLGETNSQMA